MAERYEQNVDDKVVNTEPTPLDPSPKIPVSTDASEGLSPNPHQTGETNVKGEHILEDKVVGTQPTQREDYIQLTRSQLIEFIKKYSQEAIPGEYVTEAELEQQVPTMVATGIGQSLINGELKTVLQSKTLSVAEFPLTSDIDTQHSVVNAGLLPNGDMEDLSESEIAKITLTLNRIINKGWLKTGTTGAIQICKVMYDPTIISIVANSVVFSDNNTMLSGQSYLITLDIANASYDYAVGSYNP